jgi:chemotaxis protein methyltransferase CheR
LQERRHRIKPMTLRITNQEFALLRNLIEEQCGITLGTDKVYLVESRLAKLVKKAGGTCFGDLYRQLKNSSPPNDLLGMMLDAITTNETLWFRDQYPYQILSDHILPQLKGQIDQGKRLNMEIWSCACSTGQEPYSIAMRALDFYRRCDCEEDCHRQVKILATDISQKSLSQARNGAYDLTAMSRGLSPEDIKRFFTEKYGKWVIADDVKRLVTFKKYNLKSLDYGIGPFDIIFLRNVTIYFSDSFKKILFNRIRGLLSPEGYLFLGAGETIRDFTEAFDMLSYQGAPYYRLKN